MAKLIKNELQIKACEEINAILAEVKLLNKLILDAPQEHIRIVADKKQFLELDDGMTIKAVSLLRQWRSKRIKEIMAKANKFQIALDDEDFDVISDDAVKAPKNADEAMTDEQQEQEPAESWNE